MKSNLKKRPSKKDSGGALNPREPRRPLRRAAPSRMRSKNTQLPPIDLDAASQARVMQMLVGENDCYWHHRIQRVFAEAGIATRRIERMEEHPIWRAWLTRRSFALASDTRAAKLQLRKILRDGGIKIVRDEFNIIDWRGDKLEVVFMLDLGSPGTLQRRPPLVGQGELWTETH